MAWIIPKTNWIPADYLNVADWDRIRGNVQWIWDWLHDNSYSVGPLQETYMGRGVNEVPYVHLVNGLEFNIEILQEAFKAAFTIPVIWYPIKSSSYVRNPTSGDWIRWESALQQMYDTVQYIENPKYALICGTFVSGTNRLIQKFSRGR